MGGPDPLEYKGAPFDLRITEDETYSGTNIEEKYSPETLKLNKDQQVQNQAKIKEMNDGRGDTISSNNKNQHT